MLIDYTSYLLLTGVAIGVERRRLKLQQEELCQGICSSRTLRNIEKGNTIVKDKTYEALLERVGYALEGIDTFSQQLEPAFVEYYKNKELGLRTPFSEEWMSSFLNLTTKDLCSQYLSIFVYYLYKGSSPSEEHTLMIRFLEATYRVSSPILKDLILLYLFHFYERSYMEKELDEIVAVMKTNGTHYAPHVLCCLARNANKKNYRIVIEQYDVIAEDWTVQNNYGALLIAQEIALIPLFFSDPDRLDQYINIIKETFANIKEEQLPIDEYREATYYYNIGLVFTYAKKYSEARIYLEKACVLNRRNEASLLIDEILLEYVQLRTNHNSFSVNSINHLFTLHTKEHQFKHEYNYFYYKKSGLMSPKELQNYIVTHILPLNMDGTDILYQVFLYEIIQLSHITQSYYPVKKYVEAVNH